MERNLARLLVILMPVVAAGNTVFDHQSPSYNFVRIAVLSNSSSRQQIRIRFSAYNKNWTSLLNRNDEIIATHFAVERRGSTNVNSSVNKATRDTDCYYAGVVEGEPLSIAVFSTCHGVVGFLRTANEHWNIRPYKFGETSKSEYIRHIVSREFLGHRGSEGTNKGGNVNSDRLNWGGLSNNFQRLRPWSTSTVCVEIVVVADKTMLFKYGRRGLLVYVLSTMNEAAALFRSKSISSDVRLLVSHLLILDDDQHGLEIVGDAEKTLRSFCRWKNNLTSGLPPHDLALLLTRTDICIHRKEACGTRGLAFVSGMCSPHSSCAISQDGGHHLTFAVAHEIGHTLGMLHDEDAGCSLSRLDKGLMASFPSVPFNIGWSRCSDRSLSAFLRSEKAECLYNVPVRVDLFGQNPSLSRTKLCREALGPTAKSCEHELNGSCSGVWCKSTAIDGCVFSESRQLEGLPCGEQQLCLKGQCSVGAWTEWSDYGPCSSTCANGVRSRERRCLGDTRGCHGSRRQYQLCNSQSCPLGSEDAREVACASFNSRPHTNGKYYNWVSYFPQDPSMQCQLLCKPSGLNVFELLAPAAPDGSVCDMSDQDGICVNGKCQVVGCDGLVRSTPLGNQCGVCGGSSSFCRIVSSVYKTHNSSIGYHEIVHLPVGALNIHVKELAIHHNYLAVKSGLSNRYYINGGFKISQPGRFSAAGVTIRYNKIPDVSESIRIKGPLKEPLVILVLSQDPQVEVTYKYQIKNGSMFAGNRNTDSERYKWRYSLWSNCSRSCGGGMLSRQLFCHDTSTNSDVKKTFCKEPPDRSQLSRPCNVQPCPSNSVRRSALSHRETCRGNKCSVGVWFAGQWKPCSVPCGVGWQSRDTFCSGKRSGLNMSDRYCHNASRPISSRICVMPDCAKGSEMEQASRCEDTKSDCAKYEHSFCEWLVHRRVCCHTCSKQSRSFSSDTLSVTSRYV